MWRIANWPAGGRETLGRFRSPREAQSNSPQLLIHPLQLCLPRSEPLCLADLRELLSAHLVHGQKAEPLSRALLACDVVNTDLSVHFLALGRDGPVRSRATLLRHGGTSALFSVELHDAGRRNGSRPSRQRESRASDLAKRG